MGAVLFFIFIGVPLLWFVNGVVVAKPRERIVVQRLGKLHEISGPGFVLILWPIDKYFRIDLDKKVPGWEAMSWQEFESTLKERTLHDPGFLK